MLYLILSVVSASEVLLLYEESVYSSGYQHTNERYCYINLSIVIVLIFIAIYCNNYMSSMVSIQRNLTPLHRLTSTTMHIETLGSL